MRDSARNRLPDPSPETQARRWEIQQNALTVFSFHSIEALVNPIPTFEDTKITWPFTSAP